MVILGYGKNRSPGRRKVILSIALSFLLLVAAFAISGSWRAVMQLWRVRQAKASRQSELETNGQNVRTSALLREMQEAARLYTTQNRQIPPNVSALKSMPISTTLRARYRSDPNGKEEVLDSWGRPFKVHYSAQGLVIYSTGKNGVDESGRGDDITNQ